MLYSIVIKRIHISSIYIYSSFFYRKGNGRRMEHDDHQSDFRANLIVPEYDFEINSDDDIGRFGIERV